MQGLIEVILKIQNKALNKGLNRLKCECNECGGEGKFTLVNEAVFSIIWYRAPEGVEIIVFEFFNK